MDELLKCRWCNGEPERVGVWPWGQTVRCKTCFASGPHKRTSEEADKAWNTRSGSQGVEITEDATDAALTAFFADTPLPFDTSAKSINPIYRERMRAALLAAMGGGGDGSDMQAKLDEIDMLVCDPLINEWVLRDKIRDVLNRDAPPPTTNSEEGT